MGFCVEAELVIGISYRGALNATKKELFWKLVNKYEGATFGIRPNNFDEIDLPDLPEDSDVIIYFPKSTHNVDLWGHSACGSKSVSHTLEQLLPSKADAPYLWI